MFPNLRAVQSTYRATVGPLLIPGGGSAPHTLGSAFDIWVQLQATTRPHFELAAGGATRVGGKATLAVYERLLDRLGQHEDSYHRPIPGPWRGPSTSVDRDDLLRLAWASACLIEVYRIGMVPHLSPLAGVTVRAPENLSALAPDPAITELSALVDLADENLLPELRRLAHDGPTRLGPVFAGSARMPADADLVVGHTLVELKTSLGRATATGRRAQLKAETLYQLLGYLLHDHTDACELTGLALYQARYGHLQTWRLDDLLQILAGQPVDLPALRRRWATMLDTGKP